jgi:hypothetical protein
MRDMTLPLVSGATVRLEVLVTLVTDVQAILVDVLEGADRDATLADIGAPVIISTKRVFTTMHCYNNAPILLELTIETHVKSSSTEG